MGPELRIIYELRNYTRLYRFASAPATSPLGLRPLRGVTRRLRRRLIASRNASSPSGRPINSLRRSAANVASRPTSRRSGLPPSTLIRDGAGVEPDRSRRKCFSPSSRKIRTPWRALSKADVYRLRFRGLRLKQFANGSPVPSRTRRVCSGPIAAEASTSTSTSRSTANGSSMRRNVSYRRDAQSPRQCRRL